MKSQIKSFLQVLSSNIFVSVTGIITGVLIPILLSEIEFGYWQYYLTYASYAGLLLFGFCDGIYIRFGGQKYQEIEKHRLNAMFYFMLIILLWLSGLLTVFVSFISIEDTMKRYTLYMVIVSVLLQCIISYFTLLNQGTSRFKIYSVGNIIDRLFLLIAVILFFVSKSLTVIMLLWVSIASKCIVVLYYIINSRDIVFMKPKLYKGFANDVKDNIGAGLPVTMCGIISLLMGGYAKIFIEWKSGMVNLAYFSFAFSSISIISQVIVAASLVVFPSLKQATTEGLSNFLKLGEDVTNLLIPIIMLCYYPINIAVKIIVPKYMLSMEFIPAILPVIIYQSKINILYSNTYKVMRIERKLLVKGLIGFASNLILVSTLYAITNSLMMAAVATSLSYIIWYYSLRRGINFAVSVYDGFNTTFIIAAVMAMLLFEIQFSLIVLVALSISFYCIYKKKVVNLANVAKRLRKT